MKKLAIAVLTVLFLLGCSSLDSMMDQAISLRQSVLGAQKCDLDCTVTADYGENLYTFTLKCSFDQNGSMSFQVLQPESISGISGQISSNSGKLIFDDQALAFPLLADGYISPVSAPWVVMKTLRGGYINSCGKDERGFFLSIDDSYEEEALNVQIWTDENNFPCHAEILWQGKRILTMEVTGFSCM